ncbi:nuclear transport factor 2 family protein [Ramlibacter sp.]|uniref:nuclear transport factor 2 family protein n=1 Tax=Ramlibacter sp. TaxID=1917967 RepID=UPI002CF56888|nr:nuclear transport factor 2 family protein [Ramlibacter sp.]HWI81893.1 nuclear transport factor 2 family protein [Ramlibacter sp.]
MQDTKLATVVQAWCDAYERADRALAEALLADDFTFTSPNDDRIDKATYFERCWAEGDAGHRQQVERIVVDGDRAFVTYVCETQQGKSFRNTEYLTFRGERIASVNVYFGAAYEDGALV